MSKAFFIFAGLLTLTSASWAADPTFVPKAEGHSISLTATSDRDMTCNFVIPFSYVSGNGKREKTQLTCYKKVVPKGESVVDCRVTDPTIIEPQITEPTKATCR